MQARAFAIGVFHGLLLGFALLGAALIGLSR